MACFYSWDSYVCTRVHIIKDIIANNMLATQHLGTILGAPAFLFYYLSKNLRIINNIPSKKDFTRHAYRCIFHKLLMYLFLIANCGPNAPYWLWHITAFYLLLRIYSCNCLVAFGGGTLPWTESLISCLSRVITYKLQVCRDNCNFALFQYRVNSII